MENYLDLINQKRELERQRENLKQIVFGQGCFFQLEDIRAMEKDIDLALKKINEKLK